MLALLAASGLVTVTFAPLPLPQALERLSAVAGERLECAPGMRDEVLMARLEGADVARVLKEIAFSLDAKWEQQADRKVLRPDPLAIHRREAAKEAKDRSSLGRAIAEMAKRLAAEPPVFGREAAAALRKARETLERMKEEARRKGTEPDFDSLPETQKGGVEAPAWRAMARLVAELAPQALSLHPGERAVWSDRPSPAQGALRSSIVALYRHEFAAVDPRATVARVRFVMHKDAGSPDDVEVGFQVMDANGGQIDDAQETLSSGDGASDESPKSGAANGKEPPLALPTEALEYAALMNRRSRTPRGELFGRWEPRLADPAAHEPTGWFPGAAFIAAAQAQRRNLIGTVDDAAVAVAFAENGPITASAFLRGVEDAWTLRDGWIVAKPALPSARVSRTQAQAAFARWIAQGGVDLDGASAWVAQYPGEADGWVVGHVSALLSGMGDASAIATLLDEGLPLWNALGEPVRRALRAGTTLSVRDLPPPAVELLRKRVYWDDALDDDGEVTETLPYGIGQGTISLETSEEPMIVAWGSATGEPIFRSGYTAQRYGTRLATNERRPNPVTFDRFRPGLTRKYQLRFRFGDRGFTQSMSETFVDLRAKELERPATEFLRRAETARDRARELLKDAPPPVGERP